MTGCNYEHLYLHKENSNEIYVKKSQNLKQHQIDSLRFLYKQFKKKKHGAVLNFPPGSGKSVVVALFINAVSSLLKEGLLVLCNDDEEVSHWNQLFLTWTEYKSDEIAVESSNPRLKKKIFIKKAQDLTSYLRCHWSVVVVKDENLCRTLQKIVINADFKIWITSTDVKKDLTLLLFIYNWMFPKSNFNINEILFNQNKPQEQSIIIDAFLDDFVIRQNNVKVIEETKNSQTLKTYRDNQQTATRRKNKDATGTKIKKSKRTIDNTSISNISEENREPQLAVSGHALTDKEINKSCTQKDIDINIDTVQVDSPVIYNLNEQTIKNEIPEKSDFQKDDVCVEDSTESLDFDESTDRVTDSLVDNKNICIDNCTYEDTKHLDLETIKNDITREKSETGRNDLDIKMSELEEKTMKMFKGSLLDSIF